MKLNGDDGFDSQTSQFNDTEPTSSVFTIGTYDNINKLNNNYIDSVARCVCKNLVDMLEMESTMDPISKLVFPRLNLDPYMMVQVSPIMS